MSSNSPPPISANSKDGWGPYSGATDFNRNMLIIVFILIFALFFFLILQATTRFLNSLRFRRAQMQEMGVVLPTTLLVFSQGIMGQACTDSTECAICLCEFVEGDGLRVLPNCKHWFHQKCVEVWLNCRGSCPTCRTSCVIVGKDVPEKR